MIEFSQNGKVIDVVATRGSTLLSGPYVYDMAQNWLSRTGNTAKNFENEFAAWSNGYVESRAVPNNAAVIDDLIPVKVAVTSSAVTFEANEDKYDSGGMVALIPSDADLDRLTLDGEEPRDDLHLTLFYLGDDELTEEQKEDVLREVAHAAEDWGPIEGNAFGIALWNPHSEKPAWVLNVGDASDDATDDSSSNLTKIRAEVGSGIAQDFVLPKQHTPWQPHICIAYSTDDLGDELLTRLGPVTFDKIRVAYGRETYDIELDSTLVAAGGRKRGNPKSLKDYWTKGEGLAKWVDAAHPWTTLYRHLKKYMPNDMAKRTASQWYHDVKGHWPNEKNGK